MMLDIRGEETEPHDSEDCDCGGSEYYYLIEEDDNVHEHLIDCECECHERDR